MRTNRAWEPSHINLTLFSHQRSPALSTLTLSRHTHLWQLALKQQWSTCDAPTLRPPFPSCIHPCQQVCQKTPLAYPVFKLVPDKQKWERTLDTDSYEESGGIKEADYGIKHI